MLRRLAKGEPDWQRGVISDELQAQLVMVLPDALGELLARRAVMGDADLPDITDNDRGERIEGLAQHACDELAEANVHMATLDERTAEILSSLKSALQTDSQFDLPRINAALTLLRNVSTEAQLLHLKNLCINNGTWTIPENHADYSPVLYEVTLFGVHAISDVIETLPNNWMRAADNILNGMTGGKHS
jgi:hypothetical protein